MKFTLILLMMLGSINSFAQSNEPRSGNGGDALVAKFLQVSENIAPLLDQSARATYENDVKSIRVVSVEVPTAPDLVGSSLFERISSDGTSEKYLDRTLFSLGKRFTRGGEEMIYLDRSALQAIGLMMKSDNFIQAMQLRGVDVSKANADSLLAAVVLKCRKYSDEAALGIISKVEKTE